MKRAPTIFLVAGIGWAVFYMASFTALGSSYPTIDSSGQDIVDWFTDNGTNAQIYAWTAAFAFLTLVVFGAFLTALLPRPHRYVVFAGIMAWSITGMIQAWFWAGLAFHPEGLDPATARVLFDIPQYWGPIINGATMAFALPFIALGFGASPTIPRWFAWLSVVLFVEQGIETITVFGSSGFLAPGGTMNLYLGGAVGMAWVIGSMVWGYKRLKQPDPFAETVSV